jgi:tetratricopeptide (TPR) repeat protein
MRVTRHAPNEYAERATGPHSKLGNSNQKTGEPSFSGVTGETQPRKRASGKGDARDPARLRASLSIPRWRSIIAIRVPRATQMRFAPMAALPPGVSDLPTQMPDSSAGKPGRDVTPPAVDPFQETRAVVPTPADGGSATPISTPPKLRDDPPTKTSDLGITPAPGNVESSGPMERPLVPGYEVHFELGRGGMGAVFKGRDPVLGRELAIKVLLESLHGHPQIVRRFIEEAQIGGQLQHPGIVPIHQLGQFPDGRPFFTMKLVKGRTLRELLKERPNPAHILAHFLRIFDQVAQAIAYAHARGVIHRDLKPANIMVGQFGEIQVMDWGLARVLKSTPAAGAEPGADEAQRTMAGSVLGTPAYMSPEQARGEIDRVDERGDVFALGSILCEVLTGKPAYDGPDVREVLAKAQVGNLTDAFTRLDASGADAEILRLAKACLAVQPGDRPRDASAVAAAITAYLAGVQDRLRAAEVEKAAAVAKEAETEAKMAVERRARRLTVGLAVVLLAGMAAMVWLYWQVQQQHALVTAERDNARQQKELADRNFALARQAVEETVTLVENQQFDDGDVHELRMELLKSAVGFYEKFVAERSGDTKLEEERGRAYRYLAAARTELGRTTEAIAAYEQMRSVFGQLAASMPPVAGYRRNLAMACKSLGKLRRSIDKLRDAEADYRRALELETKIVTEATAVPDDRAELAETHSQFGAVLAAQGKPGEAEPEYRQAKGIRAKLAEEFPKNEAYRDGLARSNLYLGWFLANQGRTAEAESLFREALTLRDELARTFSKKSRYQLDLAYGHFTLGRLFIDMHRWAEAEAEFHRVLAIAEQLARDFPKMPDYRRAVGKGYLFLGRALAADPNRRAEAEAAFRKAQAVQQELATAFPLISNHRLDLASSTNYLGQLWLKQNRVPEALEAFAQARELREKLVRDHPENSTYGIDLADSYCTSGSLALAEGSGQQVVDWYSKAISAVEPVYLKDAQLVDAKHILAQANQGLAEGLTLVRRYQEALTKWDRAIDLSLESDRTLLRCRRALTMARGGELTPALGTVDAAANARNAAGDVLYTAARVYALAAATGDDSGKEKYATRAIDLLEKAVGDAFFKDNRHLKELQTDRDFDVLRSRADFRQLLVRMRE